MNRYDEGHQGCESASGEECESSYQRIQQTMKKFKGNPRVP